jgi:AcrR family transcriptional regulator
MQSEQHLTSCSTSEPTIGSPSEITTSKRRRLGGRSALVQAAVFKATRELLLTEDYHALSIAEIAARAGVHETSIYRRWRTKEALVSEVCIEYARGALPMPDTGAILPDLIQLLREVIAFLQSPMGRAMVQVAVATVSVPTMEVGPYWSSRLEQFNTIIERAVERGELPPHTDAQLLLKTLIGPLYVQAFLMHQPLDETQSGQIVDLVLGGAQNPPSP